MAINGVSFGEEQQQRPRHTSGITYPALGLLAGGGIGYAIPKKLTQDVFEKRLKNDEEIKYESDLTAEETAAVDAAKTEAKAPAPEKAPEGTSATTEGTAAPSTPEAAPATAKPVAPTPLEEANKAFESQKVSYARAQEESQLQEKLFGRVQKIYDDLHPSKTEAVVALTPDKIKELSASKAAVEKDIKAKNRLLSNPGFSPAKRLEIQQEQQANYKKLQEINNSVSTPQELQKQAFDTQVAQEQATATQHAEAATKAQKEAADAKTATAKAEQEAVAAEKSKAPDAAAKRAEATRLKEVESDLTHKANLATTEAKFSERVVTAMKNDGTRRFGANGAVGTIDFPELNAFRRAQEQKLQSMRSGVGESYKALEKQASAIAATEHFSKDTSEIETRAKELMAGQTAPKKVNAAVESVEKGVEGAAPKVETAVAKAFKAIEGKASKFHSWKTAGIAAGIGLAAGIAIKLFADGGSKED